MIDLAANLRTLALVAGAALGLGAAPLAAQVQTVDPDAAYDAPIDGDLAQPATGGELPPAEGDVVYSPTPPAGAAADAQPAPTWSEQEAEAASAQTTPVETAPPAGSAEAAATQQDPATTYREDDLIAAAQGVFGEGAEDVAMMIQKLLAEQGEPNAYIVGREAGGAFIVGARYGSGTLYHKVEGQRPVYWTGPSIGFDFGANAASTFVLVYNLYDTEQLYERYPSGEGQAYVVGGLTASYLRKDHIVLIPIRVGAGLRLGINAGYMKFSKEQDWLPF